MTLVLAIIGLLTALVPFVLAALNTRNSSQSVALDKALKTLEVEKVYAHDLANAPSSKSAVLERMRAHT